MKLPAALLLVAGLALHSFAAALTERANLELGKDADRIYASLAAIHSREIKGAAPEALRADKLALLADLRGVLGQLPPAAARDWPAVSSELKNLRAERATLEAAGPSAASARAELNADIARLQLHAAYLQLTGRAPLEAHALRRNAALWSLVGAYNSAAAGKADAAWGEGRERAAALFGDGENVVVARRWRAVDTELDELARDARNGREAKAREKLRELAAFLRRAPATGAENLARHREAADKLDAAAALGDGKLMSSSALSIKDVLPHPRLPDEAAVSYAGADKLQRAQLHQLDSIKAEHARVLEREAALSKYSRLLAAPRVAKKERDAAREAFESARVWAARGFVAGKQVAAQALEAALAALDRGDLKLASKHAGWAADELAQRRAELERTGRGVLNRLARLLSR